MAALQLFLPFLLTLFVGCPLPQASAKVACSSDLCALGEPIIRFPFRLTGHQDERCGYPGFDLSCDGRNQTIINVPQLGDFKVVMIDFVRQMVLLSRSDPRGCLLRHLDDGFDTSGSVLRPASYSRNITLLNCSNDLSKEVSWKTCLSDANYMVMAIPTDRFVEDLHLWPRGCTNRSVLVPSIPDWEDSLVQNVALAWDQPACGTCVARLKECVLKNEKTLQITCVDYNGNSSGPPTGKIIVGIVIPLFLIIVGLSFYFRHRHARVNSPRDSNLILGVSSDRQLQQQQVMGTETSGLDDAVIASYPTIRISDKTAQLNKSTLGNSCAICLLDYREQDLVKIMPECDHCFHDHCVDEWLKRQATCPLCRDQQHRQQQAAS
ncbi:hypothetical protein MLD38_031456 [Melastoma candidum]|uniref:Uncharacterized protein n=1 Tax=Melastoma candidum TaxID=119954 RepID=A0ACB9MQZ7_9MYRT|nr:hypothetical protein MLD38_031456 [Melastoma candidum]